MLLHSKPKQKNLKEFDDIDIADLLKIPEDEHFDRTLGGQDSLGRKIASFGTKEGGLLLVGQQDLKHGGEIRGIVETEFQNELANAMASVKPAPLTTQRIMIVSLKDDKKLALIRISDVDKLRPCSYKGIYYGRKGSSALQLDPDEVRQYHLLYGSVNAEDMPTQATNLDVDTNELEYYATKLNRGKSNIIGSVSPSGHLTVRGVVVLSSNPQEHLEGAFIEIQKYANPSGAMPMPVGQPIKLSLPARRMIEEATAIISQNLPVVRTYEGARMHQSPAIPSLVIRETITNAIAHRNYQSHEHILIRIFDDGFDISNPAIISGGMWAEILRVHGRYHPNEGIYTFLNPALLFEGRGEGIWKIRDELRRLGKREPEFHIIGEMPSNFYVRISTSPAVARDARYERLDSILAKRSHISSTEAMRVLGVSRVTVIRMLNEMVSRGFLEKEGKGRTTKYMVLGKPGSEKE